MAKTIKVSNAVQLAAAIKAARGGETILLAAGDYGMIKVGSRDMTSTVTIKSADPDHSAVVSGLNIRLSSNLRFEDIDVHMPLAKGQPDYTLAASISLSNHIDFVGVDFSGSLDGNSWNDGNAIRFSSSTNVSIIDSTFTEFNNAAAFANVTGVVVAGNTVTNVREGFGFTGVHDVTIVQNQFSGFTPMKGDHSDSIQFFTDYTNSTSSHVVIADNVMLSGSNGGTQGIFISSSGGLRFSDFVVENNLYYGDARHGISLYSMDGATVRGNTLVSSGGGLEAGINLTSTSKVLVEGNITPLLLQSGTNTGLVLRDNVDVYDTSQKKGFTMASLFETPASDHVDMTSYAVKAGSSAALLHAGFKLIAGIGAGEFDFAGLSAQGHLHGMIDALAPIA